MTGNHFWKENQDVVAHVIVVNVSERELISFQRNFQEENWHYAREDVFVPIDARGRDGVYRWNTNKE